MMMNDEWRSHMREATRLTSEGSLTEATGMLQRLLSGAAQPAFAPPAVVRRMPAGAAIPAGTRFLRGVHRSVAGERPYKLYVPSGYHGQAVALVVMLHGCTQSADDFAAGTRMNEAAEADSFLVLYPEQTQAANAQKCWNWFNAADQQRGRGEPELLAGMTRDILREYAIDPKRVFAAGLSAGGAAASVLAATYPDLFAAVGVHSGLACGAASDLASAFAAMQRGRPGRKPDTVVPTIIFHGDRDTTVHPHNANAVSAQLGTTTATHLPDKASGGHSFTRTLHTDAAGEVIGEQWTVHGGGHAWFGGSPAGSYTDPAGPDATREMLRFFGEHPRR